MIKLMVGNNFKMDFIDKLIELNKTYENESIRVSEVFGSIRVLNQLKTARPDFRVPDVSLEDFVYINSKLDDSNIKINYTINTPIIDHKKLDERLVDEFIQTLQKAKVSRVTVAHPLLMKVISKVSDMPIEISTIYKLEHPRQLFDLKEFAPNINKLCAHVFLNRNKFALEEQKKYCDELGIELELIANEFCIQNCIVRDQCYHAHVMNKKVEDTALFGHFPMGYCISHREKNPAEWLLADFILPQHMNMYKDMFGINLFKVTGRTAPTKYLSWIVEQYLKMDFDGNLLQLWQDVKNIKRVARGHQDYINPRYKIDAKKIDDNFLLYYFIENDITLEKEKEHIKKYLNLSLVD